MSLIKLCAFVIISSLAFLNVQQAVAKGSHHIDNGSTSVLDTENSYFAKVNGIKLHYVEKGKGPLVILLHGWPETSYSWHSTITALSKKYRVVAPDLRGLGLSERTKNGYDKKTIATDIKALVEYRPWGAMEQPTDLRFFVVPNTLNSPPFTMLFALLFSYRKPIVRSIRKFNIKTKSSSYRLYISLERR